jgi:hypothetical protein
MVLSSQYDYLRIFISKLTQLVIKLVHLTYIGVDVKQLKSAASFRWVVGAKSMGQPPYILD